MTGLKENLAERVRSWLRRVLPMWPIGLAWYEMLVTQLATAAGSGG